MESAFATVAPEAGEGGGTPMSKLKTVRLKKKQHSNTAKSSFNAGASAANAVFSTMAQTGEG